MCDEAACRYWRWYPVLDAPLIFYLFRSKIDPANADHVSKPLWHIEQIRAEEVADNAYRLCISRSLVLTLRKLLLHHLT